MAEIKFQRGIFFSGIVIALFMLYCISEMIVSWCVYYTYYCFYGRIISALCLFVLTIIFACNYKKICLFPTFVCCALFFAILVDFLIYRPVSVFYAHSSDVNYIKVFPFVIHFQKFKDRSHPVNYGATDLQLVRINTITIIFAVALLIGGLLLAMRFAMKNKKLSVNKCNMALCGTTMGMSILFFIEFMRCILVIITR